MAFLLEKYCEEKAADWDKFVLNESMNGTFIQTRKFLNYHAPHKFEDCSYIVKKGTSTIAIILGCITYINDKKIYYSHKGTTFGGIIISKQAYNATNINDIMCLFEEELRNQAFNGCYLKVTPSIFQKENTDMLDYFLYKQGYTQYSELNYYMHLERYKADISSQFSSSKRRDYRYSLNNDLHFKELTSKDEISAFYQVLTMNLEKLNLKAVHTLNDLLDLKYNRFMDEIKFYGVYKDRIMIAGSMIFIFNHEIFHTQYLSSNQEYLKLYPMDFLIYNLIEQAILQNMKLFTFGICTENQGKYLNLGLSRFKEGFGTEYCINKSFEIEFM